MRIALTLKLTNLAIGLFVRIGNSKTAESQTNTSRTYIIALVAALFGFTGIASATAGIAKFLLFLFLVVCLVLFIVGMTWRRGVIG